MRWLIQFLFLCICILFLAGGTLQHGIDFDAVAKRMSPKGYITIYPRKKDSFGYGYNYWDGKESRSGRINYVVIDAIWKQIQQEEKE